MAVHVGSDVWDALDDADTAEDPLALILHTPLPLDQAVGAAELAWDRMWSDPASLLPYESAICVTAEGPAVSVDDRTLVPDVMERWLPALDAAGLRDGEVRTFRVADPWALRPSNPRVYERWAAAMIEARLAVTATFVEGRYRGCWRVAGDVRSGLVRAAVDWCYDGEGSDGQGFVESRGLRSAVARGRAVEVLDLAADRAGRESSGGPAWFVVESDSGHFRAAVFELSAGYVSALDGVAPQLQWDLERSLAAAREALVTFSPFAVRGFAKTTVSPYEAGASTLDRWDPPHEGVQRGGEETALPDAFGLALLPIADVVRIAPLDDEWQVTEQGPKAVLEHRDHRAWFGDLKPDVSTLMRSRRQLAKILRASS